MSDLAKVWDIPKAVCPAGSIGWEWDPFDHGRMHQTLARAQRTEPVFYAPSLGYWVVTRYADVQEILRAPDSFSASNANTPISPLPPQALDLLSRGGYALEGIQVNCDPPRHTRIRSFAAQAMNPKRLLALEADTRQLSREAIATLTDRDEADLLREMTYELPARVIFRLLGIPQKDAAQVKAWATDRLMLSFSRAQPEAQMRAAQNLLEFWHYVVALVEQRMDEPGDDFASDLLRLRDGDDERLTVNEINSATFGLLFAGHETTSSQSTNTVHALLSEPDLWSALVQDPALIPAAVEEGLRMYGAVANWRRVAVKDVTIGGLEIPAGSQIIVSFAAANRDPEIFPDPDRFRLDRANGRRHLTFGHGIHVCLGAPLARMEVKVMLEELTQTFPDMRLSEPGPMSFQPAFAFRAPTGLRVRPRG
ncbi:cytochrome P450 [Seohaeicola nanhaiensis]|uniref:Cytochrome P450 n=1 Tax=Seohaeicola nanhaiensis TaxID=1387282 RepID=A0ABV9KMK7_9RHOB